MVETGIKGYPKPRKQVSPRYARRLARYFQPEQTPTEVPSPQRDTGRPPKRVPFRMPWIPVPRPGPLFAKQLIDPWIDQAIDRWRGWDDIGYIGLEHPGFRFDWGCTDWRPLQDGVKYIVHNAPAFLPFKCIVGQAWGVNYLPEGGIIPYWWNGYSLANGHALAYPDSNWLEAAHYSREHEGEWAVPSLKPRIGLPAAAPPFPALEPEALPIGQFVPVPRPVPVPLLPTVKPDRWPQPQVQVQPEPAVKPRPVMPQLEVSPNKPPVRTVLPPAPLAPPERARERKFRFQPATADALRRAMAVITESNDLIDAIHDALPDKYQAKEDTPQAKAWAIFQHYRHIDPGQMAANIIYNAIEDAAIGRLHGALGSINYRPDLPQIGIGFGPAI